MQAPRQARSVASLNRMLAAAETVLQQKSFDAATLAEIARAAGVTTGAFYARFRDKEGLLRELEERVYRAMRTFAEEYAPEPGSAVSLRAVLEESLRGMAEFYATHRGTLRALVLRSRADPALRERMDQANRSGLERFMAPLLARRAEIGHPDPATALNMGLFFTACTLREAILFQEPLLRGTLVAGDVLPRELARALLAYLAVPDGPADVETRP